MTEVVNPRQVPHLFFINAVVFGPAASPNVWTNLDLSAWVGARKALVFVLCVQTGGAANTIEFRPNGHGVDVVGVGSSTLAGSFDSILAFITDAAGIIEWQTNATENLTLTVLVYGRP